jgi:hypothetical protein
MKASLALSGLRSAITRPEPADTVVHSDGDSQFRSNAFVRTPKNNGLIARRAGQRLRRQRRDGILLRPAAEERARPATLGTPEHNYGRQSSPGPRMPGAAASRPPETRIDLHP